MEEGALVIAFLVVVGLLLLGVALFILLDDPDSSTAAAAAPAEPPSSSNRLRGRRLCLSGSSRRSRSATSTAAGCASRRSSAGAPPTRCARCPSLRRTSRGAARQPAEDHRGAARLDTSQAATGWLNQQAELSNPMLNPKLAVELQASLFRLLSADGERSVVARLLAEYSADRSAPAVRQRPVYNFFTSQLTAAAVRALEVGQPGLMPAIFANLLPPGALQPRVARPVVRRAACAAAAARRRRRGGGAARRRAPAPPQDRKLQAWEYFPLSSGRSPTAVRPRRPREAARAQLGAQLIRARNSARNPSEAPPRPSSQAPTFSRTSARRRARWRPPPLRRREGRAAVWRRRPPLPAVPRAARLAHAPAPRPPPRPRRRRRRRSRRRPPPRRRRRRRRRRSATRARWLWRASPSGRACTSRRSPRFGWRSRPAPRRQTAARFARPAAPAPTHKETSAAVLDTLRVVVRLTNEHAKHRVEIAWRREQRRASAAAAAANPATPAGPTTAAAAATPATAGATAGVTPATAAAERAAERLAEIDARGAAPHFAPLFRPAGADPADHVGARRQVDLAHRLLAVGRRRAPARLRRVDVVRRRRRERGGRRGRTERRARRRARAAAAGDAGRARRGDGGGAQGAWAPTSRATSRRWAG